MSQARDPSLVAFLAIRDTTPPECFRSEAQYNEYMHLLRRTGPAEATYCWDCTPQYQNQMIEEGRCRHPRTEFEVVTGPLDPGMRGLQK